MTRILLAHGFSRDVKNDKHEYLPVDDYKKFAAQRQEIRKCNAHINELKKKNPAELSAEEMGLVSNQRSEERR